MFDEMDSGPISLGIICMGIAPVIGLLPYLWTAAMPIAIAGAGLYVGGSIQMSRKTRQKRKVDDET